MCVSGSLHWGVLEGPWGALGDPGDPVWPVLLGGVGGDFCRSVVGWALRVVEVFSPHSRVALGLFYFVLVCSVFRNFCSVLQKFCFVLFCRSFV